MRLSWKQESETAWGIETLTLRQLPKHETEGGLVQRIPSNNAVERLVQMHYGGAVGRLPNIGIGVSLQNSFNVGSIPALVSNLMLIVAE